MKTNIKKACRLVSWKEFIRRTIIAIFSRIVKIYEGEIKGRDCVRKHAFYNISPPYLRALYKAMN